MRLPRAALSLLWVVLAVVIVGVYLAFSDFPGLRASYHRALFYIAPSVERGYAYGTLHLDATQAQNYDRQLAVEFLREAEKHDPNYPYLQHQLARIAFLSGDFHMALWHINKEIDLYGETHTNSFYMRGLILGFMGRYAEAATDYEAYLREEPTNWAGINDYAWVLLKDDRPLDALVALDWGLYHWPENAWLLNSKATAHYELSQFDLALQAAESASDSVERVTETAWMEAYPGNDPLIASEGVAALRKAVQENMHSISVARLEAGKDVQ